MVWDLYCFCDHSKAVLVCASFMKKRKKVWLLPLFCQLFRWFKLKFWYEHDLTSFRAIYIACTFQLACCFEWRSVTSDWWWKYCFSPWSALRTNEISSLSFIINLFGPHCRRRRTGTPACFCRRPELQMRKRGDIYCPSVSSRACWQSLTRTCTLGTRRSKSRLED